MMKTKYLVGGGGIRKMQIFCQQEVLLPQNYKLKILILLHIKDTLCNLEM